MSLGKGCKFQEGGKADGDLKEIITQNADEWKRLSDGGWCGVSLNSRYIISLENNLSRRKGTEDLLRTNPRAALGSKYERGKRYAVTHNPESNTSLLLSNEEENVKKIEALFKEAGLSSARICCGTYALLRHLLIETVRAQPKNQPQDPSAGILYIVCNAGSVCLLSQRGDQWLELRSRTDVWTDSPDPILDLLHPFQQQLTAPFSVALIADEPIPGFADVLTKFFPGSPVTDFTIPNQLWTVMREN